MKRAKVVSTETKLDLIHMAINTFQRRPNAVDFAFATKASVGSA
jgi:hypothetical protein